MAEQQRRTGQCLCGQVTFLIPEPISKVGACHCGMCLRWGGGPLFAIHCKGPVELSGEEHIVRYKSSEWAERGFCGVCGTHLFYYLSIAGHYIMSAGALDDPGGLEFESQIFVDEKPDWYDFANKTTRMTGAEVFAQYAPAQDGKA